MESLLSLFYYSPSYWSDVDLERLYGGNIIEGSNPSLSALFSEKFLFFLFLKNLFLRP
jgi:hypothetical protein